MSDSKFDVVSIESSISVPNFTTLPQVVIWAAIEFQSGRIRNLTIHRHFLSASYLSGLIFSGEHER